MNMKPKERQILFKGPMVRAIIEGRKDVTRRIAKRNHNGHVCKGRKCWHIDDPNTVLACPYGKPGDRLWVKETHTLLAHYNIHAAEPRAELLPGAVLLESFKEEDGFMGDYGIQVVYRADGEVEFCDGDGSSGEFADKSDMPKWKPSIFMRRAYSRILLEITDVGVERLHDITEKEAIREGITEKEAGCMECGNFTGPKKCCDDYSPSYRDGYVNLWEEINGKGSWLLNPWVWRIEFKVIEIKGNKS